MRRFVALAAFLLFFWLGCVRKIEPFHTYFYMFAWSSYLLAIAPQTKTHLLWLGSLSTTVWLLFEAFNFRLHNWSYIGVPKQWWIRWPGYALSFATVMPGILWTADILNFGKPEGRESRNSGERNRYKDSSRCLPGFPTFRLPAFLASRLLMVGGLMAMLPMIWPRLFFPLVWGGVFFLVEPYVQRLGGHSLILDWKADRWHRTMDLLLSGLLCGVFWEFCNYWAGAKWVYHLPYWNFGRIFEMPFLGFIGFPAFALEIQALHQGACLFWERCIQTERRALVVTMLVFWCLVFYGIDRWTVQSWR